jgi:hypothetical protein
MFHDDSESDGLGQLASASRADVAQRLDMLQLFDEPAHMAAVTSAMARLDTAIGLVYAIHHAGPEFIGSMPLQVRRAYDRCRAAYRPDAS